MKGQERTPGRPSLPSQGEVVGLDAEVVRVDLDKLVLDLLALVFWGTTYSLHYSSFVG